MTGHNTFLTAPGPGRWWVAAGVLIAVAATAAVAGAALAGGTPAGGPAAEAPPTASSASASEPAHEDGVVEDPAPGGGPLRLVPAGRRVDDVPVGYPHELAGAVSAAIEYTTLFSSNLDLDRAVEIGRVMSDGSLGSDQVFRDGAIGLRELLGAPLSGPVPQGVSATLGINAYQLRDVSADRVTVLTLGYMVTSTPVAGTQSRLALIPADMVWHDGDWKVTARPDGAPEYTELRVQPGSAQAKAAGWLDFTQ
ncbi:hypothetical protein [Catenuloplanes indicus]|uniref:DUF8175 domain-containing protein n=1 Tax=Catenuloplanes indicus TaxID=137267 RepID=A0AAE3W078_9ACTN|nr:hypothetical protein [Catenuloplanes indicus]MDQ0366920.1 hypothetical protein [Catenuloplanes indicus]